MDSSSTDTASSRLEPGGSGGVADAVAAVQDAPSDGNLDLVAAMAEFAAARAGLARLEAGDAARHAARKGGIAGGALVAAAFAWALLLAGGLGLAAAKGLPWHWIAVGLGLVHLLVVLVLGILLALPSPPAFPLTRDELVKDRVWLENLKHRLKSRD